MMSQIQQTEIPLEQKVQRSTHEDVYETLRWLGHLGTEVEAVPGTERLRDNFCETEKGCQPKTRACKREGTEMRGLTS